MSGWILKMFAPMMGTFLEILPLLAGIENTFQNDPKFAHYGERYFLQFAVDGTQGAGPTSVAQFPEREYLPRLDVSQE